MGDYWNVQEHSEIFFFSTQHLRPYFPRHSLLVIPVPNYRFFVTLLSLDRMWSSATPYIITDLNLSTSCLTLNNTWSYYISGYLMELKVISSELLSLSDISHVVFIRSSQMPSACFIL